MHTFEEIYNAAIEKGFKIEAYSNVFDRWGDRGIEETTVQVSNKFAIWFTWSGYPIAGEEPYMFFRGRYNQNNGANQKTFKKERSILFDLGLVDMKF